MAASCCPACTTTTSTCARSPPRAASVSAGPPRTRTAAELAARLRAADADLPPGAWLRAVGYHESVAGSLDRDALDRLLPHRPVRVQHRTGALWMVNSLAVAQLGLDRCELAGVERDDAGRPTGRLWRMDRWLADRVPGLRRRPGRGEQEGGIARHHRLYRRDARR